VAAIWKKLPWRERWRGLLTSFHGVTYPWSSLDVLCISWKPTWTVPCTYKMLSVPSISLRFPYHSSRYSHLHNTNKHYSPLSQYQYSVSIMSTIVSAKRFSQASTLVEGDSARDTTLSSQTNPNPQHSTPGRNSANSHWTNDISQFAAASGARQVPAGRPSQASRATIMDRRTINHDRFANRMLLPVNLFSDATTKGPDIVPRPRVVQSEDIDRRRWGMVFGKPPSESSTRQD
jgi:hypothetical protein